MLILSLYLSNFKGIEEREFSFGNMNVITGENFTGKTTVAEGIVFGLYGISLENSNRTDDLIRLDAPSSLVKVKVKLNDKEYTIVREANFKEKQVFLNGISISQKQLEKRLDLPEPELFLYAFIPMFCLDKLRNKKGRDFFMSFVYDIDPEVIKADMDSSLAALIEEHDNNDPAYKIKCLKDDIDEIKNDLIYSEGMVDSYQLTLKAQNPKPFIVINEQEVRDRIGAIEEELFSSKISSTELQDTLELERKIMRLEYELENPPIEKPEFINLEELEREKAGLQTDYKSSVVRLKQLKTPFKEGDRCPTCTQIVAKETFATFQAQVQEEQEDIKVDVSAIVETGTILKERIKRLQRENEQKMAQYEKEVQAKKESIGKQLETLHKLLAEVRLTNQKIQQEFEQKKANAEEFTSAIRQEREELKQQLEEHQRVLIEYEEKLKNKNEAKEKLERMEKNREIQKENFVHNKNRITALQNYVEVLSDKMGEQIQQYFNRVSVKLFKVTKATGEIKPIFELLYDNKPVGVLSYSEQMRLGLEVSHFIKRAIGKALPTFMDNAESITHYDQIPGQLFTASVVEGQEELKLVLFEKPSVKVSAIEEEEGHENVEQLSFKIS